MSTALQALVERRGAILAQAQSILDAMGPDDGESAGEGRVAELLAEADSLERRIGAAELLAQRLHQATSMSASAAQASFGGGGMSVGGGSSVGRQGSVIKPFGSFGEQLRLVAAAAMNPHSVDPRLHAEISGMNTTTPSEGGFLVQKDFSMKLFDTMHEMGEVLSRCSPIPLSADADGVKLPVVDETARTTGSRWGGVRVYWVGEGGTAPASMPKMRSINLQLNKLLGIGYVTAEVLKDARLLETVMMRSFSEEMTFVTEESIFQGTGAGQPQGFLNSGALITVAKESGQANGTINAANVLKMLARMPARNRRRAVWLINQDVEPQLWQITLGSGTAVTLLYRPPGVSGPNQNNPQGTLLGIPVIPVEYCPTLGALGDIVLADLSDYQLATKESVESAMSMHVRFLYDEMAFRISFRIDGQPATRLPLTPNKGANTLSPYIVLEAR